MSPEGEAPPASFMCQVVTVLTETVDVLVNQAARELNVLVSVDKRSDAGVEAEKKAKTEPSQSNHTST